MHTAIIAVNIQEGTELTISPLLNFLLINKLQYLGPGIVFAKYRVAESRQIINTLSPLVKFFLLQALVVNNVFGQIDR